MSRYLCAALVALVAVLAWTAHRDSAAGGELYPPAGVPLWPWYRLAQCESGVRVNGRVDYTQPPDWTYNGSSGFDGGLQDHPLTWARYAERVPGAPTFAYQATPAMQVRVNRLVQRAEGWGAWPQCRIMLGLGL